MKAVRCIVIKDNKVLLLKHKYASDDILWLSPGGRIDEGETPEQAAVRELKEECQVDGEIIQFLSFHKMVDKDFENTSFLMDIGNQTPQLGKDPELADDKQILKEIKWCSLNEISERDRFFLWQDGLGGIKHFFEITQSWNSEISYPETDTGWRYKD